MRLFAVNESAAGVTLALVTFILLFSSVPVIPVHAASSPLFSMTLLAPTSNPVRRQYAAIIANSYQQVGIAANLVYVSFTVLIGRLFPSACPCGQLYAQGGYDAAFIGWGGGAPVPDFRDLTHYHTDPGQPNAPPITNFAVFHNTTVDSLIDQYQSSTNPTTRTQVGQQIITMVAQARPYAVIYYPADIFGFKSYISTWGQPASSAAKYTESDPGDYEHWALAAGSGSTINVGVTGTLNDFNPLPSTTSNSIYNLYVYGAENVALQEYDPRTGSFDNALATSITPSSDLLTWTITFQPTNFVDSAPVTADDFVFYYQSSLRNDGLSVNEGTFQSVAGLNNAFTYLNGTTHYDMNGTYSETKPAGFVANSTFTALSPTSFKFTLPAPYVFTNPILTDVQPFPTHILASIPESTWDTSTLVTGQTTTPQTVTWNKAEFGGNGSFAYDYGFIGAGPYVFKGYNAVTQVATMAANPNYYNATGLQSMGWFNAKTVHVDSIVTKSGALAAFANNEVGFLDTNYQLNPTDQAAIQSASGYYTKTVSSSAGFQEEGFNMNDPVFGTGTATPAGAADPAHAERYATDVRAALSFLIPRQYIINNLLQGSAVPGVTEMPITFSTLYPATVTADPYSVSSAEQYLAMAGYGTFVPPPPSPPPAPAPVSVTVSNVTLSIPSFLLGSSITFSGRFFVDPTVGAASQGFAVILEQSTDNSTWTPVALSSTNAGGYYSFTYTPTQTGTQYYRVFFTGLPETTVNRAAVTSPAQAESLVQAGSGAQNVTDTRFGQSAVYQVGTLAQPLSQALNSLATSLASSFTSGINKAQTGLSNEIGSATTPIAAQMQNLTASAKATSSSISSLNAQVSALNSQVSTLTAVAYAAIVIAIILGLVAIVLARRKPAP